MKARFRWILPVLAVLTLAAATCEAPVKKKVPPPDVPPEVVLPVIDFFTIFSGDMSESHRSTSPQTNIPLSGGTASQTRNEDGSVALSYSDLTGYGDNGFYVIFGKLSDLSGITLEAASELGLNLWFDTNGDGEFFDWNPDGTFAGVGTDDDYGLSPGTSGGTLTVDDDTSFQMQTHDLDSFTLAQLKNGEAGDIDGDTVVAVWVGICCGPSPPDNSATVASLVVDGVERVLA